MTHSQVYLHCRLNKGSDRKSWGSSPHEHDNELGTYWSTSSFPSTRQNYKSISRDSSIKPTSCHWAFHHLFGLIIKDSVMLKLGSGRKGLRALLGSALNWKASPWYNSLWPASFGEESSSEIHVFIHIFILIPQHHHLLHSKIQEPQGIEMTCLTCNYEETEKGRIHRQIEFSQHHHPCRCEALLDQLHGHSVSQCSRLILAGHLMQWIHTAYACAPQREQIRNGIPQDPGFILVISVLRRVSSRE